ncbi:MAG: hypothetical protein M3Q00_02110 [Pseudomonadota bacterium]|nr:hypothetical protein [Pseudomonadota bacterium]
MNWAPECQFDVRGFAAFVLLAALPLALVLSWATLQLYRHAVKKAMRHAAGAAVPIPSLGHGVGNRPAASLMLKFIEPADWFDERGAAASLRGRSASALRRVSASYAVGGAVHATVVTALLFFFNEIELSPVRFAATWLIYAWPIIPVLALTATGQPRTKALTLGAYFVALLVLDAVLQASGRLEGARGQLLLLWALEMAPPTLLLWLLGNRTLRCVGLLALLVAIALALAWFGSFQALACVVLSTRSATLLEWVTPLRALIVLGTGTAIWMWLRYLARRLRRDQTSDLMLTVDSWWLLITMIEMLLLSPGFKAAAPMVLLAFIAYKLVVATGLRWSRTHSVKVRAPNLLMLRVFGHARRTERLLDEIGLRWRYVGPINLIAGADIATSFLEPDELVQFLSGRLGDAYIADAATLTSKLQRAAGVPSADGRYALNDFFCRDNTWRACVHALAARSEAVLMDLRSFRATNRGCEFELGLLLEHVTLEKITFLVDRSTDVAHLERTLSSLWQQHGEGGVNTHAAHPVVYLLRSEDHGASVAGKLLDRLFALAQPSGSR